MTATKMVDSIRFSFSSSSSFSVYCTLALGNEVDLSLVYAEWRGDESVGNEAMLEKCK